MTCAGMTQAFLFGVKRSGAASTLAGLTVALLRTVFDIVTEGAARDISLRLAIAIYCGVLLGSGSGVIFGGVSTLCLLIVQN